MLRFVLFQRLNDALMLMKNFQWVHFPTTRVDSSSSIISIRIHQCFGIIYFWRLINNQFKLMLVVTSYTFLLAKGSSLMSP